MKNRVLGVIGGLGPLATNLFLEALALASPEQAQPARIICDFPSIPDRTGFLLGSNLRSPLPGLFWAARALERQGAGVIAIPCVTAHYFLPALREELSVEILDAVALTAREVQRRGLRRVGLLATEATVVSGLFTRELESLGIQTLVPSPEVQPEVNHLLYRNIKAGLPPEETRYQLVWEDLSGRGAEAIVLGCTEFTQLHRYRTGEAVVDVAQVLAKAALEACGTACEPNR